MRRAGHLACARRHEDCATFWRQPIWRIVVGLIGYLYRQRSIARHHAGHDNLQARLNAPEFWRPIDGPRFDELQEFARKHAGQFR